MSDRELLEKAAKAAGLIGEWSTTIGGWDCLIIGNRHGISAPWQPLHDDGDALRLAVKLHMTIRCYMGTTVAQIAVPDGPSVYIEETNVTDPGAATRRAIVRAAASLGEKM